MKTSIKVSIFLTSLILASAGLYLFLSLVIKLREYEAYKSDYTRNSSPLAQDIVLDVCQQFSISVEDLRCQIGATVYAAEFFPEIKAYFRNLPSEEANQEEVTRTLGKYFQRCEDPVTLRNGDSYYRCWYNLSDDNIYNIVFSFDADGKIERIITSSGGS